MGSRWVRSSTRSVWPGSDSAKPKRRTTSGYDVLNDAGWLRVELALGATVHSIANALGCDPSAVRAALRRHGVEVPATGLDRWERIEALTDPTERDGCPPGRGRGDRRGAPGDEGARPRRARRPARGATGVILRSTSPAPSASATGTSAG